MGVRVRVRIRVTIRVGVRVREYTHREHASELETSVNSMLVN